MCQCAIDDVNPYGDFLMVFNGQGKEKKTQTHSLEETCAFLCHHEGKFRIANGEREIRAPSFEASLCVCVCLPACVWQRSTRGLLPPLPALVFSPPLAAVQKQYFAAVHFFQHLLKTAAAGGRTGQAEASRMHSRVPGRLR